MCGWSLSSGAEDLGWLGWLGGNGRSARWGSVAGRLSLRRHGLDLQYVRLMFPHDMYGDNPQAGSDLHLIFPAQVRETSSRRNSKLEKLQVGETPSPSRRNSKKLQVSFRYSFQLRLHCLNRTGFVASLPCAGATWSTKSCLSALTWVAAIL